MFRNGNRLVGASPVVRLAVSSSPPASSTPSEPDGTSEYPYQSSAASLASALSGLGSASEGDLGVVTVTSTPNVNALAICGGGTSWFQSSIADGSLARPFVVTSSTYSGIISSLAALSGVVNNSYAFVTNGTTGESAMLRYSSADSAWYEAQFDPSLNYGGRGTQLCPYWTTSTGETGIANLPTFKSGAYGVIGKGTGSPKNLRALTILADGWMTSYDTARAIPAPPIIRWVSPTCYALGTPNTVAFCSGTISGWSTTVGSGGSIGYNTPTASRINVKSGTAASSVLYGGSDSTSTSLVLLARNCKVDGINAARQGYSYIRNHSNTPGSSGEFAGIIAGTGSAGNIGSGTTWCVWTAVTPSATYADSGVSALEEHSIEMISNTTTNAVQVRFDGDETAAISTTSTAVVTNANQAEIASVPGTGGVAINTTFSEVFALEWN